MGIPLLFLILSASAAPAPAPKPGVPYEVVKMPLRRAKAGTAHVRISSKWNELWSADAVKDCGHALPMPVPPEIDFGKWEIVALFQGAGSSSRKDPEVVSVRDMGGEVLISYRDFTPKGGKPEASAPRGVATCPQLVLKVKFTGKRLRMTRVP